MARKRINYKVLYGVLGGFVVAGGLVFLATKTLQQESPSSYADTGDVFMSEHKWPEAIQAYTKAVRLSKSGNADYLTRRGRAVRMQTAVEPELYGKDRADWDRALEVDPKYMPALTAELNFYAELAPLEGKAEYFAKMREMAERIEAIDPTQLRAVAYGPIAVIQSWAVAGVQQDETSVDQAIDKLTGILDKETAMATSQPAVATAKAYQIDPEIPFWIAMGRWKRAVVALQTGRPALAQDNVDQAVALFDKLMKQYDQHAPLAYRAYMAYMQLARVDKANSKADLEKAKTALDRARALLDDKDPLFVEVNLAASEALLSRGDPTGSIQLLRDVLATHPNNAQVTLQLARRLAQVPDKRKEAIDLLNKLFVAKISSEGNEGVRGVQMSGIRTQVNIELANLRINQYQTMKDPQQRAELLKQIEEQVTTLSQTNSESGAVQRLIGEVQMLKGQNVEAIQTFSHAVQTIERTGNMHDKAEVKLRLAQAYIGASQTGPARETLKNLIYEMPNLPGPRFMMAQVCLREGDRDGALTQYNALKQMAPDNQDVRRLGLALMDPKKQKERMEEEYGQLPETTKIEKLQKAQAAFQLGRMEESTKILQGVHDEDLKDVATTHFLAKMYNQQGNREQAAKVINESLAVMPQDPQLKFLAAAFSKSGMTPAEFDKAQLDAINALPNDRDRELSLAQYYIDRGSRDDAQIHLKKAEAAHPDDPEVLDRAFQFFVAGKQWDEAQKYLPKLTAINRDQANGKLYLFRFQFAKGDYDGALETAREVTRTLPEFAQSWLIYGQALQATGQFEQARSQYVQALAKQSNNIEALKGVITCDYKMVKPDDAHRYIQTARQAWPNDPTFKDLEAGWEMNYGDPEKVIPAREAALKANSERPENWGELGIAYMRTSFVKKQSGADGAAAAKDYAAKAWDTFLKAREKWPDNKIFNAYIAELALTGNGDFAVAEETLKQLTQRAAFKDKPDAWELLAVFYLRAGKADAAEAAMKQAVARSGKDDSTAASQYAAFLLGQRRYDEALAALETIASAPGVLGQKVEILLQAGRFPAAEALIQSAIKDHPTDVSLMDLMAITYLNMGKFDQANEYVSKALAVAPNDMLAVYNRAMINLRSPRGDVLLAIRDLTAVRDSSPDNLEARKSLAEALRRNNDQETAIRELETCLTMAPQNSAVREQLVTWYLATKPPRYPDADRVIHEAEMDPQLGRDPKWFQMETSALQARGDIAKAVDAARKYRDARPNDATAIRVYLGTLSESKQYQAVLDETDAQNKAGKDAWWMHQMRGIARKNLGDKAAAMAELDTALRQAQQMKDAEGTASAVRTMATEIGADDAIKMIADRAKTDPGWKIMTAALYQAKGDLPSAISAAESALADPALTGGERENALRLAGAMYLSPPTPNYEKGIAAYLKVLETAKSDVASMNNLACAYLEIGKPQEALKYSDMAFKAVNNMGIKEPMVYDTYGWSLIQNDHVGEGITVLLQAMDLKSFFDVHYHLAEGYLRVKPPLAVDSVREFKIAADLLAQSGAPNPAAKAKIDAGLAKANGLIKEQQKPVSQSSTPVSPAVP